MTHPGISDVALRIYDLRHLTAQLLMNAGRPEAAVQSSMRHSTASMTRRYAMQRDRGENAAALARMLLTQKSA
jgi:integrase